jgi:lipoprotein-anchoring transpeptidase ErfK/SrfK
MDRRKKRLALVVAASVVLSLFVTGYSIEILFWSKKGGERVEPKNGVKQLSTKNTLLVQRLKALVPRGKYIVVDTAENRLLVMDDQKILKEVIVSCGSGDILEEPGGTRKWIFDTPRGEFSVTSKLVNPTWIKPDWAFIEEGEKPPVDYNDRIDNYSLGEYALGFGDGFFIHGTLYTRLLGRNVTHGCVRVGDKDLRDVFLSVPMGARIYIY